MIITAGYASVELPHGRVKGLLVLLGHGGPCPGALRKPRQNQGSQNMALPLKADPLIVEDLPTAFMVGGAGLGHTKSRLLGQRPLKHLLGA